MSKLLTLLMAFLVSVFSVAQTSAEQPKTLSAAECTVGFYDQDSVARRMKGFRPLSDSLQRLNADLTELQNDEFIAIDRVFMLKPADSTTTITKEQQDEIGKANKELLNAQLAVIAQKDKIAKYKAKHIQPYYDRIAKVADTVARSKGLKQWFETNSQPPLKCPTDQTLMIDLTREITEHLGYPYHSFRIGILNKDSLMRLMPGYSVRADSTLRELHELDSLVAPQDKEIARLKHELDSLRPTLSSKKISQRENEIRKLEDKRDEFYGWRRYEIDKRDEARRAPYVARLNTAVSGAVKNSGCRYYYDTHDVIPWTPREVEYYNLNPLVVSLLKL